MKPILTIVFAALLIPAAYAASAVYDVRFISLTESEVTVELPQSPSELYMLTAASGKDDGFASYVKDIALTCGTQTILPQRSGATWKTAQTLLGPCTLHYRVDLSFTREKWEVGNEQAGFTDGRGTFVVSKALFIESDIAGLRTVNFHLPANWALLTPWPSAPDGSFHFDRDGELGDLIAFGQLSAGITSSGAFRVKLVTFGDFSRQHSEIKDVIEKVSSFYNSLFPDTPPTSYLVVLLPGDEADGEAYNLGFASTMQPPLKRNDRIVWANAIAHEMFHYWNGRQLRASDRDNDLEWFNEGFTEYFANLALVRSGLVPPDDFLHKVAVNLGQYEYFLASGLFNDVTIRAAGQKKGRYRFGVYASGWIIAFVLDQEIRTRSNQQKSLVDVMRLLLKSPASSKLTVPVLLDAVQQVAGSDVRQLLEKGISSRESIHPEHYLLDMGLDVAGQSYQDEFYIHKTESPTAEQLARRRAWCDF